MKKLTFLLPILLLALSIPLQAADAPTSPPFSVDLFGAVNTADFNDTTELIGIGANLDLGDYLGVGIEGYGHDFHGTFIDTAAVNLRYRIQTKTKATPYIFGGGHYNLGDESYGIQVGVGVEHKFSSRAALFGDVRMVKPLDTSDGPTAQARVGLRFYLF